jgi:hypothetical protein
MALVGNRGPGSAGADLMGIVFGAGVARGTEIDFDNASIEPGTRSTPARLSDSSFCRSILANIRDSSSTSMSFLALDQGSRTRRAGGVSILNDVASHCFQVGMS